MSEEKEPKPRATAPEPKEITAKISGYRQLSPTEQALMNEVKDEGAVVEALIERIETTLPADNAADMHCIEVAKEHLQTGLMWLTRSIAKPSTFALMLVLCCLASCAALGGQPSVVARTAVVDPAAPSARPAVLFQYDGNTMVAWTNVSSYSEVFLLGSWLPIVGPFWIQSGHAWVVVQDPPFEWVGSSSDYLPPEALSSFRPAEIEAWNLAPPDGA